MQSQKHIRLLVLLIMAAVLVKARIGGDQYYTAAVYEHRLLGEEGGGLKANLERYKRAVEIARQQGADIILFPEYGLVPPSDSRSETRKRLEIVPDPRTTITNPCTEMDSFRDRPILTALSCMAKDNDIAVVANMGSLQPCRADEQPGCPRDGAFQFNTNVAFGKNGTLLARYYKEHLFLEAAMDLPYEEQDPVFETEFGTFAMFICFDIYFEKMADASKLNHVDAILFSTMWFNAFPFYVSTQWFEAWSKGNDAILLASNIQVPAHALSGSGIFRGRLGPQVLTQNPDGVSKLLVATLPRGRKHDVPWWTQQTAIFENGTVGRVAEVGRDVTEECSFKILGRMDDNPYSGFRCSEQDISNYTLVELRKTEGRLTACNGGMCCELVYSTSKLEEGETFYLGVSNSTNNSTGWRSGAEENCLLVRCEGTGRGKPCSTFPALSNTLFHEVTLTANFTTPYVYPSFLGSSLRPVMSEDWHFASRHNTSTVTLKSDPGVALIAAYLKGRVYSRDPPYIR